MGARTSPGSTPRPAPTSGWASSISCPAETRRRRSREVLRYTHGDRFPKLPGYRHFHQPLAHGDRHGRARGKGQGRAADDARPRAACSKTWAWRSCISPSSTATATRRTPARSACRRWRRCSPSAGAFRRRDPVPSRRRGQHRPGQGPAPARRPATGFICFPRPVYWTMKRAPGQPFVEDHARHGRVYHVGNGDDMVKLLEQEARPGLDRRTPGSRASSWTPDFFRDQPFFKSDLWLGAAWKAMPADLSLDKLGKRAHSTCSTTWPTGDRRSTCPAKSTFSRSITRMSSTAT